MKKNLFKIFATLVVVLSTVNFVNAQLSRLSAKGGRIVNANGDTVLLRGVNLGGWLLQEGYILGPGGNGTQGDFKRKLYNLGYTDAQVEAFYQSWRDNFITKADIDYVASKGFNCVRIPMHYELFLTDAQRAVRNNVIKNNNSTASLNTYVQSLATWYDNGQLFADPANLEGFKTLERLLSWCAQDNLYVIVDLHAAPGSQGSDANIADPLLANDLWNRTYNGKKIYQDIVVRLWETIAAREKDNNNIAMYDLINEPNNVPGGAATIYDVMNRSISAIRAKGDTHLLLIEGDGWGNEFGSAMKPANFTNKTNLVYNSHRYGDQYVGPAVDYQTTANPTNTNKMGYMTVFRDQNNVPVWVGETGENSSDWVSADIDRIVGDYVGYAYWTLKRFSNTPTNTIRSIPGPFLTDANPDLNKILTNIQFANSIENASQLQAVSPNTKAQRKNPPYGKVIWIKGNNGQYVSSENANNIRCNKTTLGNYEKFTVVNAGDNKVALKSFNNTYISSENGTKAITSTRTSFSGWEAFEWWEFKDGGIALRGFNKKFLSSENGADSMRVNREKADFNSWEKFTWGEVITVSAPVISSGTTANGTVGNSFTYSITASNNPTSYSASNLPAGLSINTSTGVISGTPTVAGSSNVTISATNAGGTGTQTLVLTISPATDNSIKVVAYVPNWIDLNTFSNSIDYAKLTHINIAFENPTNASGDLSYNATNDVLITKAHANNVKILVSLGGGSASEDATLRSRYFSLISSANRAAFVTKIANFVTAHNLDGIDIDLEGPAINADYGPFIQALSAALSPKGKIVSAALSQGYGGANVPTSTYQYFDYVNIMAYDATGPWDPNTPGQHSSFAYAQSNVNYFVGQGLAKSKAVVGVPFYGYGFGSAFRSYNYTYNEIVAAYPGAENLDQVGSTIWYNGIPTVKQKTNYAITEGLGGIMIWSLDSDAPGSKSLLTAINEAILAASGSNPVLNITAPLDGTGFKASDNINVTATATDADGIAKVEFFNGATKLGEDLTSPYSFTWNNVPAGVYTINVKATDKLNNSTTKSVSVGVQGPYNNTIATIPGKIEAENYDLGGQGVAYNDTEAANKGGQYRTSEGVDIETCTDTGAGYNVGYTAAGEWMKYAVNVTTTGKYNLQVRVASTSAGNTFRVELDGTSISGTITVPNTGAWQTFQTVSVTTPTLTSGNHTLRIYHETGGYNLNYINFDLIPAPVITSASTASGKVGTAFLYSVTATNTPTGYAATGLPGGLTIDAATGIISGTPTTAGSFPVTISATKAGGTGSQNLAITINPVTVARSPYGGTAWVIPGKIEAENYDNGGEGVAYHDIDVQNKGGQFRLDEAVDVETCTEGGYNTGWMEGGEWLEYTVNVQTAGKYTLEARVASGTAGTKTLHVEMNGVDISGPISFTDNNGWQVWNTLSVVTPELTTGEKIMRIVVDQVGFNLNYINFNLEIPTGINIQAEDVSNVKVYPNPATAGKMVNVDFGKSDAGFEVKLYNYIGQEILKESGITGGTASLQLPGNMAPGYYNLQIINAYGHKIVKKLIVH